jgi:hypothetical protein
MTFETFIMVSLPERHITPYKNLGIVNNALLLNCNEINDKLLVRNINIGANLVSHLNETVLV